MVQTSTHPWHGWIVEVVCKCGEAIPVISKSIRMSPNERAVIEAAKAWRAEKWNIFQAQRLDRTIEALEAAEGG
jgi:hypothetical protein